MTDEGISRRQVLRAASIAGGLGIASGAGTSALLGDGEAFASNFGAGTLDLEVLSEDLSNGEHCEWNPTFVDEPDSNEADRNRGDEPDGAKRGMGAKFGFPPHAKPSGVVGIALTVCDNPGRVTLEISKKNDDHDPPSPTHGGRVMGKDADPGHEERVGKPQDGGKTDDGKRVDKDASPDRPGDVNESSSGPSTKRTGGSVSTGGYFIPPWWFYDHEPSVELRARSCDGPVLAEGELSSVLASLEDGVPLGTSCTYLGKLEASDDGEFTAEDGEDLDEDTFAFGDVTVEVTDRDEKEDGEVIGVDLAVDGASLCRAVVKGGGKPDHAGMGGDPEANTFGGGNGDDDDHDRGGPEPGSGIETYSFDCENAATVAAGENPGEQQSAISNVELYVCGDDPCIPCAPKDPYKLFLFWNGGLLEKELSLEFSAEQCRHSDGAGAGGEGE